MKAVCFALIFSSLAGLLHAQDSLSLRDAQEIKLLAQRKVERGLTDLLNTVSFEDLGEFERKALMTDSYGDSPNKLFYNAEVIIEDDINPEHTGTGRPMDVAVDKYLGNLELFYKKSAENTINFSDFRVSDVKKTSYYYVKVFYKSFFKGQHNQIATPYKPVERVAEIRAEKKGKKWVASIARLGFVTPADSANATLNDVLIAAEKAVLTASTADNQAAIVDEAELAREKEREAERKAREEYNHWLDTGDKAFAEQDYEKALEAYTEADKRNDYDDLLPRKKIYQVKRAFEKAKQTQGELLREYLAKASVAQKSRRYTEAIGYLRKASELKPDSVALGENIKLLNQKARIKAELDEKYNAGQYSEVIKDYSSSIKKDKTNSDYYLGRGMAYVKTNKLKSALEDFNKAIESDFANLAALEARAELYVVQKDIPKAIGDLTSALNIDATNAELFVRRATLKIQTRNHKGAFEDYDQAIKIAPKISLYYYLRGHLFAQNNDNESAISDFSETVKLDDKHPLSYYERGLSYVRLQKIKEAGADFNRLRQLGIVPEQQTQVDAIAQDYFRKGLSSYNNLSFEEAIVHFDESLLIKPDAPDAWYYRGMSYAVGSEFQSAISSLSRAIQLRPDYSEAFFEKAKVHYQLTQYNQAAADYRQARTLAPTYYLAFVGEGHALFQQKLYDKATLAYETIKVNEKKIGQAFSDSLFADVYHSLGLCYYETGLFSKALDELSRAIDKKPDFSAAYFYRGKTQEAGKNLRKAIADYRKAVALDDENPLKYFMLANALQNDESYEDAIKMYESSIRFDPKNQCCRAISYINQGDCYYIKSKFELATRDYLEAFQLDDSMQKPTSNRNVGFAFIFQKKPQEALRFLEKATNDVNIAAEVYYGMACAYLQQKKIQEALQWFEKAFQTAQITRSYLRKDKMIEISDKNFENNTDFKALTNRLLKK
ncbi:tetratricopeptide repeat protein [Runella sp.]|uniref:tetratricopeptide repeat protein n=1 Tax=Runella sp. TaxID=1960881 RepID=UPI0030161532